MKVLLQYLAVGAAGFLGAVARYAVGSAFGRFHLRFPLGTLVINVTGSLFLGWFLTFVDDRRVVSEVTRIAIAAGFVGAYTTFSTFMFDTAHLADEGLGFQATLNLIASVVLGLLAVRFGMFLARRP